MKLPAAVFLSLLLFHGCVPGGDEPGERGKRVYICREAFEETVEGYVPVPAAYLHALSIREIIVDRLDEISVELENHLSRDGVDVFVKIMVDYTDFESRLVNVPAGGRKSVEFSLPAVTVLEADSLTAVIEPAKPPGLPEWEAGVDFGQRDMTVELEDYITVRRADFDGHETGCSLKWEGIPGISIVSDEPGGISADIYTGWDPENFYVAAAVLDEKHFNSSSGSRIWDGDSLQFAVSPPGGAGTFNLMLALAEGEIRTYQSRGPDTGLFENSEFAVVRDDAERQTFYELKIPLERLKIPPEKGVVIGFNAVVFDDDDGRGYDYWIEIAPGIAGGWDPAQFRRFVLWE